MCSESKRDQQEQKRADKMRPFLSIRSVETREQGFEKVGALPP